MGMLLFPLLIALPVAVQGGPNTRALVVGGGPNKEYNQVGIESNVRYLERILGTAIPHRTLFADGKNTTATVLYTDKDDSELYRKTKLTKIDGPSQVTTVATAMGKLGSEMTPGATALLYFTGHGRGDVPHDYANNMFDMWMGKPLTVSALAKDIRSIPNANPVVVIMVQCFSGGFGNLIFENGSPTGAMLDRDICGFFSAVPVRMSAGCYPTTDESDYKDFTGYFFAALTGTTRIGGKQDPPDYDKNGVVGMDEAYAYSLINDDSIDTPVCTSDFYLRRFVKMKDSDVFALPYSSVLAWATPAQAAVLEGLSQKLKISSEDRVKAAERTLNNLGAESDDTKAVLSLRFMREFKSVVLAHELRTKGAADLITRYDRLIAAEARNPLAPPATGSGE